MASTHAHHDSTSHAGPAGGTLSRPPHAWTAGLPARSRQVEIILERVDAIPTLNPIAARVLKMGASDSVEVEELSRIIETDPALAVRILGMCRRSDRGLGDKITSVRRAVVMLGLDAVRSAVLAVSVFDLLARDAEATKTDGSIADVARSDANAPGFNRTGFWKHSVAVACAAEIIATDEKRLGILPEEAFLAGLLHGVGRIVLSSVLPRAYDGVTRLAERRGAASASVERELLGTDHHTAGRRVVTRWQLPAPVADAVWLHDQPAPALEGSPNAHLVLVVTAARALCRRLHLGWSGDFSPLPDARTALNDASVRVSPETIAPRLHEAVASRLSVLGIDAGTTPQLMLDSLASATDSLARTAAALDERARLATDLSRVLDVVARFERSARDAGSLADLAGMVLESTETVMGSGHSLLVVLQPGGAMVATRLRAQTRAWTLPAPSDTARGALCVPGPIAPALLAWLTPALGGVPNAGSLRVVAIGDGRALLTDSSPPQNALLGPLTACWETAIHASLESERSRRLEEQLVQANRSLVEAQGRLAQREALARLGETAAGAAHEFNNPLTVIAGRADLLLARLQGERDKAAVSAIAGAAQQISGMIASLHLLGKVPTPNPGQSNLVEAVRRSIARARKRADAKLDVSIDLLRLPESFCTDTDLLVGALVELLANALEACPRGPVTLTEHRDDDTLSFVIADAGPGLSEHALRHAFDPFFSERQAGRGRGMGLTRARVMAQALGGDVHLESEPGKGCRATLTIRDLSPQPE